MTVYARTLNIYWAGYDSKIAQYVGSNFSFDLSTEEFAAFQGLGKNVFEKLLNDVEVKRCSIKKLDYVKIYEGESKILGYQNVHLIENQGVLERYYRQFNKDLHAKLFGELKGTFALRLLTAQVGLQQSR